MYAPFWNRLQISVKINKRLPRFEICTRMERTF